MEEIRFKANQVIFTIGSDPDNDYVVKDPAISHRHVEFKKIDSGYYVFDLKSETGTKLNGLPLIQEQQVVDGDEIVIGDLEFIFQMEPNKAQSDDYRGAEAADLLGEFSDHPIQDAVPDLADQKTEELEAIAEVDDGGTKSETLDFQGLDEVTGEFTSAEVGEASASTEGNYYLQAIYGPYLGKKYPLKFGETKIGRDNTLNDIVIRHDEKGQLDPSISRRHATISYRDGRFYVTDKRSKTRTYVNQTKLDTTEEIQVSVGDEIEIVSDQKSTILRMTPENVDLSPPKKAGIWWIRNSPRLGLWLSVALALASVGTFGLSYLSTQEVNKKPEQLTFVEELWIPSHKIDEESVPTAFRRDGRYRNPSLALADVDGDKDVDLVITDTSGHLKVIDGKSKEVLWDVADLRIAHNIPVVLSDLNENGLQDILVIGDDTRLRALDGATGTEIWMSPILGDQVSGTPVVSDLDGDGLKDIVICTVDGRIHLGYGQINQVKWVTIETGKTILSKPSTGDWDGDGLPEVFIGTEDGKVLIVDGQSVKIKELIDIQAEVANDLNPDGSFHIRYPIALADLNMDDQPDLIVGSTAGAYVALNGRNLRSIWQERLPSRASRFAQNLGPAVGDCDGDAIQDVVIASNQVVRVIRGSKESANPKEILWTFEVENDLLSTPVTLADFNKDGAHDVVIGTRRGSVFVLNGKNGEVLAEIQNQWNAISSPLLVADLRGDGFLDISYIREDGSIYVMESNSIIPPNSVVWGQSHGDERNIGQYAYVGPSSKFYNVATSASGLLFVCVALMTVSARQRRFRTIHRNREA